MQRVGWKEGNFYRRDGEAPYMVEAARLMKEGVPVRARAGSRKPERIFRKAAFNKK